MENPETSSTNDGPPPLPYSLLQHKWAIIFFWGLFVIDSLVQPLVLYYTLRYETSLTLHTSIDNHFREIYFPIQTKVADTILTISFCNHHLKRRCYVRF